MIAIQGPRCTFRYEFQVTLPSSPITVTQPSTDLSRLTLPSLLSSQVVAPSEARLPFLFLSILLDHITTHNLVTSCLRCNRGLPLHVVGEEVLAVAEVAIQDEAAPDRTRDRPQMRRAWTHSRPSL